MKGHRCQEDMADKRWTGFRYVQQCLIFPFGRWTMHADGNKWEQLFQSVWINTKEFYCRASGFLCFEENLSAVMSGRSERIRKDPFCSEVENTFYIYGNRRAVVERYLKKLGSIPLGMNKLWKRLKKLQKEMKEGLWSSRNESNLSSWKLFLWCQRLRFRIWTVSESTVLLVSFVQNFSSKNSPFAIERRHSALSHAQKTAIFIAVRELCHLKWNVNVPPEGTAPSKGFVISSHFFGAFFFQRKM